MRSFISTAALIVLAGCAAQQPTPVAITEPPPVCTNQRQCEAMWAAASNAIEQASGMRVRYQTDTVIETFVPVRQARMHGRVLKKPLPAGGYMIAAQFDCTPAVCDRLYASGLNLFNATVTNAGRQFTDKK